MSVESIWTYGVGFQGFKMWPCVTKVASVDQAFLQGREHVKLKPLQITPVHQTGEGEPNLSPRPSG